MSRTIPGVDVSSWQHEDNRPIDWEQVYAEDYRFAIIKATQGTTYCNPWVVRDIQDANAAGLLVGAYHYFEAGEDAALQAKWFGSNLVMQQLDLGIFVDWECYFPKEFVHTQELTQFLSEARTTRAQCGVYCSETWASILTKESVNVGRLWVAGGDEAPLFVHFAWQKDRAVEVGGINGPVLESYISNTRGLDVPTSPPERPNPNTAYSVKAMVDDEAEAVEAETEHDGLGD